jgi:LmbE family N-acetylglucosaminyl deacetylase
MALVLIILLLIPLLWATGFLLVTDFSIPSCDDGQFHRVFAIFPHPDDEAVGCGGFLHRLSKRGVLVTLLILTKGERGTPKMLPDPNLKSVRVREAETAAHILRIGRLIQEDFGDGALQGKKKEMADFIGMVIERERPDLLITYDLAGFYGHPDHIACSEIITELKQTRFQEVPLWYVTFPKRILTRARLPEHVVPDLKAQVKRALPTHKAFIGASVLPKIKAWYAYKSQRASLTTGIRRFFPIWFFLSMMLFEYFAEAN